MKNILVLGDSHVRVFNLCNKKQKLYNFDVCDVGGATAQGCINPNGKSNCFNIFSEKLKKKIKIQIKLLFV